MVEAACNVLLGLIRFLGAAFRRPALQGSHPIPRVPGVDSGIHLAAQTILGIKTTMDPVTAAGFASAIITFIDFSWKIVKGSYDVYTSSGGTTNDQVRINNVVQDLQNVTKALSPETQGLREKDDNDPRWRELRKIAVECQKTSKELSFILRDLEGNEGNKVRRSLELTWKGLKSGNKVAPIEKSLDRHYRHIMLQLSMIIR